MCFLFSFIPFTFWAVVGYFVLFSSSRTEHAIRRFGQVLSIWIFLIAIFFPVCGAYVSISGICPINQLLVPNENQEEAEEVEALYVGEAKEAIAAIWAAAKVHHAETGEWPTQIYQLKKLNLESLSRGRWSFTIASNSYGIQSIGAMSTDRMPGGAGKLVIFDARQGIWSGYGIDQ